LLQNKKLLSVSRIPQRKKKISNPKDKNKEIKLLQMEKTKMKTRLLILLHKVYKKVKKIRKFQLERAASTVTKMKIKLSKTAPKKRLKMQITLKKIKIRMKEASRIEFKIHKNFYRICKKLLKKYKNKDIFQTSSNAHMSINKLFL